MSYRKSSSKPIEKSSENLLSIIPAEINIQYILPQLDPETTERYLASSTTLAKDVQGYENDQLY